MDVYIKMRGEGVNEEYDYLGGEPDQEWWSAYKDLVNWNEPGMCARSGAGSWALYLAPIPSGRLDARMRRREFKIALAGPAGDPKASQVALPLLGLWLEEVTGAPDSATDTDGDTDGGTSRLQDTFSAAFPDDAVTRLRGQHDTGSSADMLDRFQAATRLLHLTAYVPPEPHMAPATHVAPAPEPGASGPPVWWGRQDEPGDRRVFLYRVGRLLAGEDEGVCVLANLVYRSDAEDEFLAARVVRCLHETGPGSAYAVLGRPGQRPKRTVPNPDTRSEATTREGGVVPGKVRAPDPASARHATHATRMRPVLPEPVEPVVSATDHPDPRGLPLATRRFLRQVVWASASLALLLAATIILLVMTLV